MTDRIDPPVSGPSFGANPSFVDLLRNARPDGPAPTNARVVSTTELPVPRGTTVLGLKYSDGVIMAGDRRATSGYTVADPKMRKVFAADDYSAIAIAGAAGQAIEMVKLFQLELEHYEKITGDRLSLEGKANRLAQMIRSNFPLAMQGLVVVPLFGDSITDGAKVGSSTTTRPGDGGRKTTSRRPAPGAPRRRTR